MRGMRGREMMSELRDKLSDAQRSIFDAEQLLGYKPNRKLLYRIRIEIVRAMDILCGELRLDGTDEK